MILVSENGKVRPSWEVFHDAVDRLTPEELKVFKAKMDQAFGIKRTAPGEREQNSTTR